MTDHIPENRIESFWNKILCAVPKITEATDDDVICTDGDNLIFSNLEAAKGFLKFSSAVMGSKAYLTYGTPSDGKHYIKLERD